MSNGAKKLELTWIGKETRPRLEPRILLESQDQSYHATQRVSNNDIFDNRLVYGDNLLALKALEQQFSGKVKCIYIDPPYNTGSAFNNYDDGIEHSLWLSLMRDRLELLRKMLREDGSIWINIDDNECHYLKLSWTRFSGDRISSLPQSGKSYTHEITPHNISQRIMITYWYMLKIFQNGLPTRPRTQPKPAMQTSGIPTMTLADLGERSDLTAAKPYSEGHYQVVGPSWRHVHT